MSKCIKSTHAGLLLSANLIDKEIRSFLINQKDRLSDCAPIYCCGSVEYIISEIFDLASQIKTNNKITLDNIKKSIQNDDELRYLFDDFTYEVNNSYSMLNLDYCFNIGQILGYISVGTQLDLDTGNYLNEIVRYLTNIIVRNAILLKDRDGRATLDSRAIQTSIRLVFPSELAKHAVSAGTKAITKYVSTKI